jgi:aminopeptidase
MEAFLDCLVNASYEHGLNPYVRRMNMKNLKDFVGKCDIDQIRRASERECTILRSIDGYIGIKAEDNIYDYRDIPSTYYQNYIENYLRPMQMEMASKEKWVLLNYPTQGSSQLAGLSLSEYEDVFIRSSSIDYDRLAQAAEPLKELLDRTEMVRIVSPGTDLTFSINNIPSYICDGRFNIPDGEIFTAPILDSANGSIAFNVPSLFHGYRFEYVHLKFQHGKVVFALSSDDERLNQLLSTDEGASRIGEFGIGLNSIIVRPMNCLAYDEKMAGSIHIALGQAYEMAYNGNESNIHWDMVLNQRLPTGGELYFDGQLVRKNGRFILPELLGLNSMKGGTRGK